MRRPFPLLWLLPALALTFFPRWVKAGPVATAPSDSLVHRLAEEALGSLDTREMEGVLREIQSQGEGDVPPLRLEPFPRSSPPEQIWRGLGERALGEVARSLRLLARIGALLVLASLLSAAGEAWGGGVSRTAQSLILLGILGLAGEAFAQAAQVAVGAASAIRSLFLALLPLLTFLASASGLGVTSGLLYPLLLPGIHLSTSALSGFVIPALVLATLVEAVSGFSEGLRLSGLASFLRLAALLLLGFLLVTLLGLASAYGLAGGVSDGALMRGTKFAARTLVPVVGGLVADATEVAASAASLIRGSLGLTGMLAVAFAVALPLIKIASLALAFRLAQAVAYPFGAPLAASLGAMAQGLLFLWGALAAVGLTSFLFISGFLQATSLGVAMR